MKQHKLVITSGVANTFEWYDYVLFAHLAPIIGQKFFPATDKSAVLLQVFLVFALGYLMRPLGGVFFGIIGDKLGRKVALSTSIMCMAIPTALVGFLPTYETCGILSTILMIIIRMMQGLSMGGALTGSVSFVIEHTPKKQRGLFGSIPMSSICAGILLGSIILFIIKHIFTPEQFENWGWRIPFILGIAIYFTGIYIKKHTPETPLFKETQARGDLAISPLKITFKEHWFDMLISIFINMTGSIVFYFATIHSTTYLKTNRGFADQDVSFLTNSCYIIMIFVTLFSGWLSDKIGRVKLYIIYLLFIIVTTPFLLNIIENGDFIMVSIALMILCVIAAAYIGPEPALQAEFYPTKIRNTALSVSYNTATSVFGGTTPFVIESLVQKTNTITSAVYYIIIAAIIGIISLYFYKDRSVVNHNITK